MARIQGGRIDPLVAKEAKAAALRRAYHWRGGLDTGTGDGTTTRPQKVNIDEKIIAFNCR